MDYQITPQFSDAIQSLLLREEKLRSAEHEPSGKISAGMMAKPSLICVLQLLGVPKKELEAFTIGKFARGNQAEEWLVEHMVKAFPDKKFKPQYEVSYQGGIGYVDLAEYNAYNREYIPHEIKSVSNAAFRYLREHWVTDSAGRKKKMGYTPNMGHAYQGTYYALASKSPKFYLHYVAADDLRVLTFEIRTSMATGHVNAHIAAIKEALKSGELPSYQPFLEWHGPSTKMRDYCDYPEFWGLSGEQAEALLEERYPAQYKKLKGIK